MEGKSNEAAVDIAEVFVGDTLEDLPGLMVEAFSDSFYEKGLLFLDKISKGDSFIFPCPLGENGVGLKENIVRNYKFSFLGDERL